ncbi:hypothetical protein ACTXT7_015838 [Hymenolepis weldensis]
MVPPENDYSGGYHCHANHKQYICRLRVRELLKRNWQISLTVQPNTPQFQIKRFKFVGCRTIKSTVIRAAYTDLPELPIAPSVIIVLINTGGFEEKVRGKGWEIRSRGGTNTEIDVNVGDNSPMFIVYKT